MEDRDLRSAAHGSRRGGTARRWLCKTLLFCGLILAVLNPNLKRAFLHVRHALQPGQLIQTDFPALAEINARLDSLVAANRGGYSEARLVGKFVLREIEYASDYENWGNVEYWPKAEEVWRKKQEDCDGRAILATSILQSRGYHSARLVVGLDHMWIKVDENEKDPRKSAHWIALLNPNPDFSLELRDEANTGDLMRLVRALLHPTALREASTHLFADMPVLRKAILVLGLLWLCMYPCKHKVGLFAVLTAGLLAVMLLADWQPGDSPTLAPGAGACILLAAVGAALFMDRALRRTAATLSHPPPQPRG